MSLRAPKSKNGHHFLSPTSPKLVDVCSEIKYKMILEYSTGGSSIGNNKEVQTARAKNVYRQTQNFDHRHNKGGTTKAQQRWNNHTNRILGLQQTMCDS